MEKVQTFLKSIWNSEITAGIISGLIVFFVTKFIAKKAGKKEYNQQVKNANSCVINALKPYIADCGLPKKEVFKAIIDSTARKFGVSTEDMFSAEIFCEELIQEIITDVYVPSDKKEDYTKELSEYIDNLRQEKATSIVVEWHPTQGIFYDRMKEKFVLLLAMTMGLLCAILSILMPMTTDVTTTLGMRLGDSSKEIVIATVTALLAICCVAFAEVMIIARRSRYNRYKTKKHEERKSKENEKSDTCDT